MAELVADEAPRLFAVVQEYGERVDGRTAAWGMAFEDHAEVIGVDRGIHVNLGSPEQATRAFNRRPHITARVMWVNPGAHTRPDGGSARDQGDISSSCPIQRSSQTRGLGNDCCSATDSQISRWGRRG
jgi:hypothetical protein